MSISKKGNRWRIALYVGQYPDGRSRYEYRYAGTEAEAKRIERQELKEREELYGQGTSNQKLRLFVQDWLETVRTHQAKRTYVSYEAVMRLRVLPTPLAEMPLNKITPAAVQQWVNGLARTERGFREATNRLPHRAAPFPNARNTGATPSCIRRFRLPSSRACWSGIPPTM